MFRTGINSDDEIFKMNANGSGVTNLTNTGPAVEERPVWSPAGDKIAFTKGAFTAAEVWTMNPDGTRPGQAHDELLPRRTAELGSRFSPATRGRREPARCEYRSCPHTRDVARDEGDAFHGPPLAYPSCASPRRTSAHLTVGSPDANGKPASSVGSVRLSTVAGDPATPADEADLALDFSLTDVRKASDLTDYAGELEVRVSNRITDRDALPGPVAGGTVQDIQLSVEVPCTPTSSTTVGSTCATNTTLDAITPGAITELKRSLWQLDRIRVFDGGADGDVSTGPDTLFAVQGIFVP